MTKKSRTIAIAGAGIAGLTAALLFERLGFEVLVFEQSKNPVLTGTGLQISSNAYKILDDLGLGNALKMVAFSPESVDIYSGTSGSLLTKFQLGSAFEIEYGAPYLVLHRADLSAVLRKACEKRSGIKLNYGETAVGFVTSNSGAELTTESNKGKHSKHNVMAVIGADGVWSKMRKYVPGCANPKFTGRIAWRTLLNMEDVPDYFSKNSTGLWLGPNTHLVHYPLRKASVMNVVAITPWDGSKAPPQSWLERQEDSKTVDFFKNWRPEIRQLLSESTDWGGWPLHGVSRVEKLAEGPLCLVGDAGHAMVPYAAQGGASAIEDVAVLAQFCSPYSDDLTTAFSHFEKTRLRRIQKLLT